MTEYEELTYEILSPLSVVEDRNDGRIVIYQYSSRPVIEISTRIHPGGIGVMTWCEFHPSQISMEIQKLIKKISFDFK